MIRLLLPLLLALFALPLGAQEGGGEGGGFRFSGDVYLMGRSALHAGAGADDLFAMGDRVAVDGRLAGSAYLIGRNVTVREGVGINLYAAGNNVELRAPVGGDAMLMGADVLVGAPVAGDLRVGGDRVELTASIGDSALIGAGTIYLDAPVAGDAGLAASEVEFGPAARVDGILHLYGADPEALEVPESVAPPARIQWHPKSEWDGVMSAGEDARGGFWAALKRLAQGIFMLGILATALAAIAPDFLASVRARALEAPLRSLWLGFLSLSAAIGSAVLLALSGLGLLLVPVSLLLALAVGLAGFLIGTYVLGVALMRFPGRSPPTSLGERAVAAFAGAVGIAILSLLPFLGWLVSLSLALWGAGGLMVRWVSPGFFTEAR